MKEDDEAFPDNPFKPKDLGPARRAAEQALTAWAAAPAAFPDIAVSCRGGHRYFGHQGEVTVTVHGNGRVVVIVAHGDHERSFERSLEAARLAEIAGAFAVHRLWALVSQRTTGVPDEVLVALEVESRGHGPPLPLRIWWGERSSNHEFDAIVRIFAELAREVSDGTAEL